MKVDLTLQFGRDPTLPVMPVKVNTGSALALELVGVPRRHAGGEVSGVSVVVTNANGEPLSAVCAKVGDAWCVIFAASGFAEYGFVRRGFCAVVEIRRADDSTASLTICGDFEVVSASAAAQPGNPSSAYQVSGGDVYLKSAVVADVQHYVKQSMVYDARVGWGATWGGDYIKTADGTFVEFTEG